MNYNNFMIFLLDDPEKMKISNEIDNIIRE